MRGRPPTINEGTILDAARDAFREEGHSATTAGIARRAGVSEGSLFYRYKSKEALLAAVIRREAEPPLRLNEVARQAGNGSLAANLQTVIETVLAWADRIFPLFELAITSSAPGSVRDALLATRERPAPERIVELIARWLQAEIRLGRARPVEAPAAARAIHGACTDYLRACHFAGLHDDRPAFVRSLVDFVLDGITPPLRSES